MFFMKFLQDLSGGIEFILMNKFDDYSDSYEPVTASESFNRAIELVEREKFSHALFYIDDAIENALGKISEFVKSDRSYIYLFEDNNKRLTLTHKYYQSGIKECLQ